MGEIFVTALKFHHFRQVLKSVERGCICEQLACTLLPTVTDEGGQVVSPPASPDEGGQRCGGQICLISSDS